MDSRRCCAAVDHTVEGESPQAVQLTLDTGEEQQSMVQQEPLYIDGDGHDVIIPDRIARPLVISAHLLLVTSILSFWLQVWAMGVSALLVYITSILHWSAPRFSGWPRIADYLAVGAAIITACVIVITEASSETQVVWFVGLAFIGVGFTSNESRYYMFAPTLQGEELERFYTQIVWTHLFVVHVTASTLALYCLIATYGWP